MQYLALHRHVRCCLSRRESLIQETPTAYTFRNCRHVALLRPARRSLHLRLKEVGANVVANGSGAINLPGLIFQGTSSVAAGVNAPSGDFFPPQMNASFGAILTGQVG